MPPKGGTAKKRATKQAPAQDDLQGQYGGRENPAELLKKIEELRRKIDRQKNSDRQSDSSNSQFSSTTLNIANPEQETDVQQQRVWKRGDELAFEIPGGKFLKQKIERLVNGKKTVVTRFVLAGSKEAKLAKGERLIKQKVTTQFVMHPRDGVRKHPALYSAWANSSEIPEYAPVVFENPIAVAQETNDADEDRGLYIRATYARKNPNVEGAWLFLTADPKTGIKEVCT